MNARFKSLTTIRRAPEPPASIPFPSLPLSSLFRGEPFIALAVILNVIPEEVRVKVTHELATDFVHATDIKLQSLLKRMCEWILLLPMANITRSIATWVEAIVNRLAGTRFVRP